MKLEAETYQKFTKNVLFPFPFFSCRHTNQLFDMNGMNGNGMNQMNRNGNGMTPGGTVNGNANGMNNQGGNMTPGMTPGSTNSRNGGTYSTYGFNRGEQPALESNPMLKAERER